MSKILEVCVDNFASAVAAITGGANRLELCSSLTDGGLTPSVGFLKQIQAVNNKKVQIFCMLRCRSSNFVYSEEELNIMVEDAKILTKNGADGFVFGALLDNGNIDLKKCREIIKICYPLPVTFHRAFDVCSNPLIQLESIIDLGFQRLLTSGQAKSAEDGVDFIKKIIKRAKNRIVIMPGSGITKENIKKIAEETEAEEFHGSFKKSEKDDVTDITSKASKIDLGSLTTTDSDIVAEVIQLLKTL